ncbi:MAG TPA: cupin domain-containing protein [Actinomycetota bacterium]
MTVLHVPSGDIEADRTAIEVEGVAATVSRITPGGESSGWHHHGDYHIIAYMLSGTIRVESGAGGHVVSDLTTGDLVHIGPRTIHRETFIGDTEIAVLSFWTGSGTDRVDVPDPEPAD